MDPSKTGSTLKTVEDVKAHLENQLRQARLAAQQVGALLLGLLVFSGAPVHRDVSKVLILKTMFFFGLEASGAAETEYNCHHSHNNHHHHLSQRSVHATVHRPEDGSGHIWNQDGPRIKTGLSSFLPTRQELPAVVCFLGQAGSEQQQLR